MTRRGEASRHPRPVPREGGVQRPSRQHAPVLVLLGSSTETVSRFRRRLPMDAVIIATTSAQLAAIAATECDGVIVLDPPRGSRDVAASLRALRSAAPDAPIVCATQRSTDHARLRADDLADELVTYASPVIALLSALEGARTGVLLRRTVTRLMASAQVGPQLRAALDTLLKDAKPVRSVVDLSERLGVERRTLWYQWRRFAGEDGPLLEDFITWVLLLQASILRTRGETWGLAAHRVGLHRQSFARIARRVGVPTPSEPWDDLSMGVHEILREKFEVNVASRLLPR